MQPPKVSVLIPTYEYARYLSQAIESVLDQSYTDFELIISDDASSDGSADIIRRYAQQDRRIRFELQSSNLGMVANWNWCLREARGQYIKYLFGDDYLCNSNAIKRLVEMMEQKADVRLAASARRLVDMECAPVGLWNHIGAEGVYDGADVIAQTLHRYGNLIGEPSAVMFRRADANRGFDASFRQIVDWEFWLHLLQDGSFAYTDEPLCAFRRHPQQKTEINRLCDGAMAENARLLETYACYLVLTPEDRQRAFNRLYQLSKKLHPDRPDIEWLKILRGSLGKTYYSYWIRRKAAQPFINVRRFWKKHVTHTFQAENSVRERTISPHRDS
jgi:glycosyltransferase involved in cell wall biosynthesis